LTKSNKNGKLVPGDCGRKEKDEVGEINPVHENRTDFEARREL